jgi:hypothetical protein
MDNIREFLTLLFTKDPDSGLWSLWTTSALTDGVFALFGIDPTTARVEPAIQKAWVERLTWQLGALRLAAEIHAAVFTAERRDRIERAIHEAEVSLDRCVQFWVSTPNEWSDDLDNERQLLLGKMDEARAYIREVDRSTSPS